MQHANIPAFGFAEKDELACRLGYVQDKEAGAH